jgi:hypothetical protein
MKQFIFYILLLTVGHSKAQKLLPLPENAKPSRKYAQCLIPDSAHRKDYRYDRPFLANSWQAFLLEKTPKLQKFTIELPIFDTILLRIPVDKLTRMANLPDEYGLVNEKFKVNESSFKWKLDEEERECLSANTSDCFVLSYVKVPAEFKTIQKLVVKSTAHQQRYDDKDTIVFKQVIEIKALKKVAFEVAPQYERVFMKENPDAVYTEWRKVLCTDEHPKTVLKIQKALKQRGYDVGPLDDIMREKTKAACIRFQKDNHLDTGKLTKETLQALEVWEFDLGNDD